MNNANPMAGKISAVAKATRGPFLILTPICIFLGLATTYQLQQAIDVGLLALVLIAALCAHISVNALNEYLDYTSGLDALTTRTPFSGGSGGLLDCPEAQGVVLGLGVTTLLITMAIGLYLVSLKGLPLLLLGLAGIVIILAYTKLINQLPLLGLVSPGLAFGPVFVFGTYLSLAENPSIDTATFTTLLLNSAVPFFLVNNLLLINQLPDVEADSQVGRKTFPIAFGKESARHVYLSFLALCGMTILASVLSGHNSALVLATLLPLLLGLNVYQGIGRKNFQTESMIPFMGKNVAVTLVAIFTLALTVLLSA